MTVQDLLARASGNEILEWLGYLQILTEERHKEAAKHS